ncbi:MBL fold metallo-hydrolase [bacterium]|nr:MBL fold metallo-hydrolase [bacterium]
MMRPGTLNLQITFFSERTVVLILFLIMGTILGTLEGCCPITRGEIEVLHSPLTQPLEIHILDVGYGESIVIVSPDRHFLLWDGGYPERAEMVRAYLCSLGVHELDVVVNSHPHPDHIGGLSAILEAFRVKQAWGSHNLDYREIPIEFRRVIENRKIPYKEIRRGFTWSWGPEIELHFLNPVELVPDLNDSSLVCQIRFGQLSLLLNADIGPRVQQELVGQYQTSLRSNFCTIAHHGGWAYLPYYEWVGASFMTLSVGQNPWRNPRAETISFIESLPGLLLRTDVSGTIVLRGFADGRLVLVSTGPKSAEASGPAHSR